MTTNRTSLQDDLLADLQQAAPIPVTRPEAGPPAATATAPVEETPTVALRLTPRRWARPSLSSPLGGPLELAAGPVRISVTGFDL
jgi:hypothetical protein